MFCDRCGTNLEAGGRFCPVCGKSFGYAPPPANSRVSGHIRLLGILWLAMSAFRLIPGFFLLAMFRHNNFLFPPEVPFFVHGLIRAAGSVLLASAVVGIMAGWGLLERAPWARMLAIVVGCVNLIDMPFGTALGAYTLWVLLPSASEEEYRGMARPA